ncbi:SpoIIE family protein phosphatase [Kitasatospora atroaurantiaca]|uniref:Serine phosphatase RsbU (Regulator of sigma subunit) n=1 Tax=Kitasatospora atroaurantiaca TaxID=285545 RepID=A0A561EJC5_9ACTN|nr:SpoIIE family protein phosphatase [Kitasatospora atroaurantiaca]TWE15703.1 serine phosphatase RsbU (regulator of sigma subunit) [Kitasatospora atroaurantiaca]
MHAEVPGPAAADALIDAAAAALATGSSDLLRQVVGFAPVGLALLDTELRWQYANAAFTRTTGLQPADLIGKPVAATPFAAALRTLHRVLDDGRPRELVTEGPAHPGATPASPGLRTRYQRLEIGGRVAGVIAAVLDIAEPQKQQQHDLEQANARLAILDAAAEQIGTTLDIDTTCAELADFAVRRLAELVTVDLLPPDAPARGSTSGGGTHSGLPRLRRTGLARTPEVRLRTDGLALPGESVRYREGSAVARSLETGRPVVANLLSEDELSRTAMDHRTLEAYRAAGIDSVLVVPLAARGHVIGAMVLARARGSSPGFTDDEVVLIEDLAGRAAISIDNARRYARSQGIALELQRALLAEPGNPHPNLELASRYLPSGTSSVVGGDWYETVRLPFGRTLLVMGDVMGHGVEAAVDMSNYRSMLRYVAAMDLPPHRILRQLDALISEDESARPATCLLALADPARSRWTLSSAGHLPPALIAPDRPTELIDVPTGPPLGTGLGGYEQGTRELLPGQVLLLYTDGLVERRDEDIDVSLARLAALRPPTAGDLDGLLDAVLHGLTPHAAEDDIALLAARVRPR